MTSVLDLLWAKTDTNDSGRWGRTDHADSRPPQPHRVMAHLLDTAAVAGVMYDQWLAPTVRSRLDALCPNTIQPGSGVNPMTGRKLVTWLAGVHDIGKISPAFQAKSTVRAAALPVPLAGQACSLSLEDSREWRHTLAGGSYLLGALASTPWESQRRWISSVVVGHHGVFAPLGDYLTVSGFRDQQRHGGTEWDALRDEALLRITRETGVADTMNGLPALTRPGPADIAVITGIVIMADWVASNGTVMPGVWGAAQESVEGSAARARAAWRDLAMHAGWAPAALPATGIYSDRFPTITAPRPVQRLAVTMARAAPRPSLMIVEAPMGEGKTELALITAEIFAHRFGCDGIFFGLPTQATSDAILDRVAPWLHRVEPGAPLALAHGKAMVNSTLRNLPQWSPAGVGVDCDGARAVAEWFLSAKRLLLAPFVIGTIDQVLLAGAQISHLALRMLGLAGKVVILDEIHAADVYMSVFLDRALSWLGEAGVPVILMSATLPTAQRRRLIAAYTGLEGDEDVAEHLEDVDAYPRITLATGGLDGGGTVAVSATPSSADGEHRPSTPVRVTVLDDEEPAARDTAVADGAVADLLDTQLAAGGCALVIRNTVGRASALYEELCRRHPHGTVVLFHGQFTAGDKSAIANQVIARLGKDGSPLGDGGSKKGGTVVRRPVDGESFIVVATQVAEQSLDIDADVLVTDLCPIDLLLQRVGRMWRHPTNTSLRPMPLQETGPQVFVTRMRERVGDYTMPRPRAAIYPLTLLARTAHLVQRVNGSTIDIPTDIPALVAEVYDRTVTDPAFTRWDSEFDNQQIKSRTFAGNGAIRYATEERNVDGLNTFALDGEKVAVRDGEFTLEVAILCRCADGRGYLLHTGEHEPVLLPGDGSVRREDMDTVADVVASTMRLPQGALTTAAFGLKPLPAWQDHPFLRNTRALVLDEDGTGTLLDEDGASLPVAYSSITGLTRLR